MEDILNDLGESHYIQHFKQQNISIKTFKNILDAGENQMHKRQILMQMCHMELG